MLGIVQCLITLFAYFSISIFRWVLKCHACYKVTTDVGRIFCPNCGNGGTLRKVAVTVGENGIVIAARRPRVSLRGTKVRNDTSFPKQSDFLTSINHNST